MTFKVYRDCDTPRLRLRKVVLELYGDNGLLDRRRMFMFPFFAKRLKRKKARMVRLAYKMLKETGKI